MAGRTMRFALGALATTAVLAPPASAVTAAHNGALNKVGDKYEWSDNRNVNSGGVDVSGVFGTQPFKLCDDPGWPCDHTLLHVTSDGPVQLDVEGHDTGLVRPDIDMYLYTSDAAGTVGDRVDGGEAETTSADEFMSETVEPGYYLVRVAYWSGFQNNYTAKATLNEPPPPDPEDEGF